MRSFVIFILAVLPILSAAQEIPFAIQLEEISIPDSPGIQSYVWGRNGDQILLIGGRTDGLHQRQPFAAFLATENNTTAYVLDLNSLQSWSASLNGLPASIYEQLQSTNMEFEQQGSTLYAFGGYGYSNTFADHITYPYLTAIEINGLIGAIQQGQEGAELMPYFRQLEDERFAVTGGYLGILENVFYLAGGQYFEGRYNPMGPDHGPGFIQEYTDAVRVFTLNDDGQNLEAGSFEEWVSTPDLHRRDYNMLPQVFPGGEFGFTMFSGVFQIDQDIPWHNTVDVLPTGFTVNNSFDQLLNQYHTAHVPIYDGQGNAMHSLFFGGMSRYQINDLGELVDDINVPFVTTISRVTRHADGSMDEAKLGIEMPGFLGSSAEFIVTNSIPQTPHGVILLDEMEESEQVLGYIIGGIESTDENIFFINTGTQSEATTRIFRVLITPGTVGVVDHVMNGGLYFNAELFPNPVINTTTLKFNNPGAGEVVVEMYSQDGKLLQELLRENEATTALEYEIDFSDFAAGIYYLHISNQVFNDTIRLVKQ